MTKLDSQKIIFILGLILVFVGGILVISAFPSVQQSIWPYENAVAELARNVPPISATRIIISIIVIVAGFALIFFSKLIKGRK